MSLSTQKIVKKNKKPYKVRLLCVLFNVKRMLSLSHGSVKASEYFFLI